MATLVEASVNTFSERFDIGMNETLAISAVNKKISQKTIQTCIDQGWARPWFENPIKSDWLVCRLTDRGRDLLTEMVK